MADSQVKYHFPSIDILRFFAAMSVVVYHCIEHFSWTTFPTDYGTFWFRMGWIGVDIFFVISGFVISLAAFSQIDRNGVKGFRRAFMKKRLCRIIPLHYLTILIFIIFLSPSLIYNHFTVNLLSHLLFVHNFSYFTHGDINGVNWSLGAEMQFYILIALLAACLRNGNVYKVIIAALLITYCWRLMIIYCSNAGVFSNFFHTFVWATQLPGMLDEFLVGYLIARFVRSRHAVNVFSYKFTPAILFFAFSIMLYFLLTTYLNYSSFWPHPLMVLFFRTCIAITFGVLIVFLCSLKVKKSIRVILTPFYYGGTISYGIYLWHYPVLLSVKEKLPWLHPLQSMTVTVFFTLALSALSWHFFEKNFLVKKI